MHQVNPTVSVLSVLLFLAAAVGGAAASWQAAEGAPGGMFYFIVATGGAGVLFALVRWRLASRKTQGVDLDGFAAKLAAGQLIGLEADLSTLPPDSPAGEAVENLIILVRDVDNSSRTIASFSTALNDLSGNIKDSADGALTRAAQIRDATGEVSRSMDTVTEVVTQVADNVSSIAAATDEMSATVTEIAENMERARSRTEEAAEAALGASNQVKQLGEQVSASAQAVRGMGESLNGVRASSEELRNDMQELDGRTQKIGQIMDFITDIADQTNLLALNAAIEAARAGEAGRGFAVVADEVRKLAEKTMSATKDVEQTIGRIRDMVERSLAATEKTVAAISSSAEGAQEQDRNMQDVEAATQAARSEMERVGSLVREVSEMVFGVASAAEEQSAATNEIARGIGDISNSMSEVSSSVSATSAATTQVAQSSKASHSDLSRIMAGTLDLHSSAQELGGLSSALISRFTGYKVGRPAFEVGKIKTMHLAWRARLQSVIDGYLEMKPEEVASHHECDFGKWVDSVGRKQLLHLPDFEAVDSRHEKVYSLAREIVADVASGSRGALNQRMKEFETIRVELFEALDRLYRGSFSES